MNDAGVRLAKRVAAAQGCSRREAEWLITSGAVQVAGQTITEPAHRVAEQTPLQIQPQLAASAGALTVLLHKPAGASAAQALSAAWPALAAASGLGPAPPTRLLEQLPLPLAASGLSVWTDEAPVLRRLADRQRPLETEWLLGLPLAGAEAVLGQLHALGARASLGHAREGRGQWRLVAKGADPHAWLAVLDARQGQGDWQLRRQRIGRLGLSPLAPGQARARLDFEKF